MKTLFIALRSATFTAGFILLWGWVALRLHRRYDDTVGFALPEWTRTLGLVLLVAGGAVALACITTFAARGEGTPAPFDPPRKFVAVGPYKFVRNPMYLGGWILLIGFGLYKRSPAILVFALPWLLFAHLFVILYEEPHLRATFGAPYDIYCRSVHRWLPRSLHTLPHHLHRLLQPPRPRLFLPRLRHPSTILFAIRKAQPVKKRHQPFLLQHFFE